MELFRLVAAAKSCNSSFLAFPHWYEYLQLDPTSCQINKFSVPGDLTLVVLALIDILLRVAGIAAVVYVIYGGIQYVTSQGNPDATAKAQSTIVNALIGLVLAVTAVAFVSFLGSKFGY